MRELIIDLYRHQCRPQIAVNYTVSPDKVFAAGNGDKEQNGALQDFFMGSRHLGSQIQPHVNLDHPMHFHPTKGIFEIRFF